MPPIFLPDTNHAHNYPPQHHMPMARVAAERPWPVDTESANARERDRIAREATLRHLERISAPLRENTDNRSRRSNRPESRVSGNSRLNAVDASPPITLPYSLQILEREPDQPATDEEPSNRPYRIALSINLEMQLGPGRLEEFQQDFEGGVDPVDVARLLGEPHIGPQLYGDVFEDLTNGRRFLSEGIHAVGFDDRLDLMRDPDERRYRTQREVPLPFEYCYADTLNGQSGEAFLHRPYDEHQAQVVRNRRRWHLESSENPDPFPTLDSPALFRQRQARHLAGLDTSALDFEIARRVLMFPEDFGWLGEQFQAMGFVTELERDGENYHLR